MTKTIKRSEAIMENLLKNSDIRECGAPISAANNTDSNSDIIDMSGYEGAIFIATITDSEATGVATQTIEQNTANSDSGMAAVSGGASTKTCVSQDDINNTLLVTAIHKPLERYIQAVRTSGTANIAFGSQIVILYGAKKTPITQGSSVSDNDQVVSPAEA
jgi:hypothetical protein